VSVECLIHFIILVTLPELGTIIVWLRKETAESYFNTEVFIQKAELLNNCNNIQVRVAFFLFADETFS